MSRRTTGAPESPEVLKPWHPRFGLRGVLLTMLVVSVMAAGGRRLAGVLTRNDRTSTFLFIVFTLATPLLVMVLVSLLRLFVSRRK